MKAQFEYSREDVERIVLEQHAIRFPSPSGMVWAVRTYGYSGGRVTIEAISEAEQASQENPGAEKIGDAA